MKRSYKTASGRVYELVVVKDGPKRSSGTKGKSAQKPKRKSSSSRKRSAGGSKRAAPAKRKSSSPRRGTRSRAERVRGREVRSQDKSQLDFFI